MPEPFVQTYEVTVPRYKNSKGKQKKVGEEKVVLRLTIDIDAILERHGVKAVHNKSQTSRAGNVLVEFLEKIESEEQEAVIG